MKHVVNNIHSRHQKKWFKCLIFGPKPQKSEDLGILRVENTPYKVCSIQVDGSSEFMNGFKNAYKELVIPLIILLVAKPTYNDSNRGFRNEFYDALSKEPLSERVVNL